MRSEQAKVLHRAGGLSLIEHVVRTCRALKPSQIIAIIGHQADVVGPVAESLGAKTVLQQPQRGTGHAIQVARRAIRGGAKLAIVVSGDAPLVRTETLASLIDTHRRGEAAATILSAGLEDPREYGRVIRDAEGRVQAVVEEKSATPEQKAIREVNSSIYCFTLAKLWPALNALRPDNPHKELYLTDTIGLLRQKNERVLAEIASDPQEIFGCNTRAQLAEIDRILRARKTLQLMDAGATIYLPETVVVDPDVAVGVDTVIEPGVHLLGNTHVGARCRIGMSSYLKDMRVDDDANILPHCVFESSRVGSGTNLGPFTRLRPGADLRANVHLGNFVEVKNSVVGEGTKANHLTYIGDASVGKGSNIGAGTITCNYDGVAKHKTVIGDHVFVGSDSALVAPVRIGSGAYVGAGSVITDNVPPDALAIARGRQVNKKGWAKAKRAEMARAKHTKSKPKKRRKS
jgi:bifunctional UDP-N-acetylglucosamine pyrophosphorylase/glucosamine-1-phosphate N-acetyltransferase